MANPSDGPFNPWSCKTEGTPMRPLIKRWTRREIGRLAAFTLLAPHVARSQSRPKVLVVGGGSGGATLANCLSDGAVSDVTMIEGYDAAAMHLMPHAWKAGEQTLTLRRQLESMADGGLFVMVAPPDPFPCPPAPYERGSLIAAYFKQHEPRSKNIVIDAKNTFVGQDLFEDAWNRY